MRNLLIGTLLVAALAACGGGGSGGGGGSVLPPPPSTMPPTAPPTSPPPSAAVQVTYPGQGGSQTVTVTVQKSAYAGITSVVQCAYRGGYITSASQIPQESDSHYCDPNHPYVASTGQRAGVQGNYWTAPTNLVDNGSSISATFQLTNDYGGDAGIWAVVQNGTASFLNLNSANVSLSSSPTGTIQVLTSSNEIIGPSCAAPNNCPTVTSLGLTVGGWQYIGTSGKGFQPVTFYVNEAPSNSNGCCNGHVYPLVQSPFPEFGTGMDLTQQGFGALNNNVRFVLCTNQPPATSCGGLNPTNTENTNPVFYMPFQETTSNTEPTVYPPYYPAGNLEGIPIPMTMACGQLELFASSSIAAALVAPLDVTQVLSTTDGTTWSLVTPPTGFAQPGIVCYSATN